MTATVATFVASWRYSNCTIRAGDHRNKEDIKAKIVEIKIKVFSKSILLATMGVGLGQPPPSSAGLFLDGVKGGFRGPEVDLKLTVFPSCLRIMVPGYPPLPEETPGVIAFVGVRGVQR